MLPTQKRDIIVDLESPLFRRLYRLRDFLAFFFFALVDGFFLGLVFCRFFGAEAFAGGFGLSGFGFAVCTDGGGFGAAMAFPFFLPGAGSADA